MKNDSHNGATAVAPRHEGTKARRHEGLPPEDCWTFDGYEVHPLARYTPFFSTQQREALEEHIRQCGSPPVLKHGEQILGDHNVIRACHEVGVDVHYVEWHGEGSLGETVARSMVWPGQLDPSRRSALAVPVSEQLRLEIQPRRYGNLSEGAVATGKPGLLAKNPKLHICANSGKDEPDAGLRSAKVAADLFQVSESAVNQARHLWKDFPDLFSDLLTGRVNLSQARLQASRRKSQKKLSDVSDKSTKRNQTAGDEDELFVGECRTVMKRWTEEGKFDLIFADPPYNIGVKYHEDPTKDLMSDGGYVQFSEEWIKQCARLLGGAGSMFVMINRDWQSRLDVIIRGAGLHYRATIVWHCNFPKNIDTNFLPAARFIHYFTKHPKKFTWNPDLIRVPSVRDQIGDARRVSERGIVPHDVWDDIPMVPGNGGERVPWTDQPPQVPAKLLERILLAASNPGDRVFDPFVGNGTTWRAARKLGRAFTGIERSPLYARQAEQWAMAEERP